MMRFRLPRKVVLTLGLIGAMMGLSACDPTNVSVGVSGGVYYDSMLWNDYYYGRPRPPQPPVQRPPRPEHPIARPPVARPPIHRPPTARPGRR